METQIITVDDAVRECDLSIDSAESLRAAFAPHFEQFQQVAERAREVGEDPASARLVRLELKRIRCDAERARKSLKEDSIRRGKAIDGINNVLLYALKPIEDKMEEIETAEARRIRAQIEAKMEARRQEVSQYADPLLYNITAMDDEQFAALVAGLAQAKRERDEREERERRDAEARAEVERQERARAEEERRKREAEQAAEIARLKAEQAKRDAEIAAERARVAEERRKAELAARAEREAAEAAAAEERRKRESAEAEARAIREKQEADRRAEVERLAQEAAKREAEERAKAAAPDRAKIAAMAADVRALRIPSLATSPGLAVRIAEQVEKFAAWLESESRKL